MIASNTLVPGALSATILGSKGEVAIFRSGTGRPGLAVRLEQGTLWLNINQLAALFERDKSLISRHLRSVYPEGELERETTVAIFATFHSMFNISG